MSEFLGQNQNRLDLSSILSSVDRYREQNQKSTGMVYTDNWYDSHPRLLIFDPVLNPYDKLVWLTIRSKCSPDFSLAAFPSYDEIQAYLNISRGTVSNCIAKLRVTRWVTLLCRNQVRNESGRIQRDGNVYMVHGEQLSLADTFELDANYMAYLQECGKHRNPEVRKLSGLTLASLSREMEQGRDVLENQHPFERRSKAWSNIKSENCTNFCDQDFSHADEGGTVNFSREMDGDSTVVHHVNHGKPVHRDSKHSSSSSSSKNLKFNNNNYNTEDLKKIDSLHELTFPKSITENQKHLIKVILARLPDSLPSAPPPWTSWYQLLLDELSGRIAAGEKKQCFRVWNPVSLMSTYCQRLTSCGLGLREDGQFQIENAESARLYRIEKEKNSRAYEEAHRRYQQRTLDRANKFGEKK